jgi:MFS family permease
MTATHAPSLPADERPAGSAVFIALYALALFGVFVALLTPPVMTLALRVAEVAPASKEAVLSLVLGLGSIVSIVTNPVAGLLSDRTSSRFGMRRPWILGGLAIGTVGLTMIAAGGVPFIVAGWCITQLGFNFALPALLAILPDQVPSRMHGWVSGVLNVCLQVGIVAGVFVAQAVTPNTLAMFMVPGLIAIVFVVIFTVCLNDRRLDPALVRPLDLKGFVKSLWISPHAAPDFWWAFASRFLLFMGLATLLSYQVFYLLDKLHLTPASIPETMLKSTLITTATTVVGSLASGWLSDRMRRRKIFVLVSALVYALGLAVIGVAAQLDTFLVGIAICGFGQGVYLAVDLALVTEVLPDKQGGAAKDLGLFSLANNLPQTLAPAVAPLFLAIGALGVERNYTSLFVAAAVFAGLGAVALLPIKGAR